MKRLRIAAIEPYAALSHILFLEGLREHSAHELELLTLPARAWKWRMRTAALHFAREVERGGEWDAFLVSDYLALAEFRALLPRRLAEVPALAYFHENQLTYPLQPREARDNHFALTHLYSMAVSSRTLFNSAYHRDALFAALGELLERVPDVETQSFLEAARERSGVLPLGTDVLAGEPAAPDPEPVVLWTHRWEYDKDPDAFVDALVALARRGVPFRVRALGQRFRELPPACARLRAELGSRVLEDGFAADRDTYLAALRRSHVFVSTARHEFFGLGTLEALRSGLYPVVPDDLAYPELFPPDLRADERRRYLYPRADGLAPTLEAALLHVREGAGLPSRRALIAHSEHFSWSRLAPRFDRELADLPAPL